MTELVTGWLEGWLSLVTGAGRMAVLVTGSVAGLQVEGRVGRSPVHLLCYILLRGLACLEGFVQSLLMVDSLEFQ